MKWKRISPKGRDDLASELVEIVRSGQKVEAEKPIALRALLRICRTFGAPMSDVVRGLDGIAKRSSRRERD